METDIFSSINNIMGTITPVALTLLAWLGNRKINRINARQADVTADGSALDNANKVIAQWEGVANRAIADKDRAIVDRDIAYSERNEALKQVKEQRKAKQEWREKYFAEKEAHHETQISKKELEAKLAEAEWHRCETNGCEGRKPPRKRTTKEEQN